jgi:cytochrome c oxidase subunit 4
MTDQATDHAPGPVVNPTPAEGGAHAGHPSELEYIKVAALLALITGAEVAIYYVKSLKSILVPALLVFSAVKFSIVVLWFMHLRFDSRLFRRLFVTGVVLAMFVFTIVLTTFHVWTR